MINTNCIKLTSVARTQTPASYLLLLGGVLQDVRSEKRVLFIVIVIHPFAEMIPNVESPEREMRDAENEANYPSRGSTCLLLRGMSNPPSNEPDLLRTRETDDECLTMRTPPVGPLL